MNVLYLTNKLNYTDGVTTHLYYLIKNLADYDINVFVLCSGGDAIDKFRSLKVNIDIINYADFNLRSTTNFLRTCRFINQFSKKNKIRILHSHNHYLANAANIASNFCGSVNVQTIHGLIPGKGVLKHYASDFYIGVNKHITDFIISSNISTQQKCALIYNGIDTDSEKINAEKPMNRIIAASRLVKEKGLQTYIKAVSGLNDRIKSGKVFYISGEGEYEEELRKLNNNLNSPVEFTGVKKDLEKDLSATGIFVLPTSSESEGFPMTLLEAGKAGCLIISSDFHGSENILEDNADSLIFRKNDHEDLKAKLEYAFSNPEKCREMANNFYKKIRNVFTSSIMSDKCYEFYKKII